MTLCLSLTSRVYFRITSEIPNILIMDLCISSQSFFIRHERYIRVLEMSSYILLSGRLLYSELTTRTICTNLFLIKKHTL